eukprot:3894294-Ditylum_brightwellii.AAC.1
MLPTRRQLLSVFRTTQIAVADYDVKKLSTHYYELRGPLARPILIDIYIHGQNIEDYIDDSDVVHNNQRNMLSGMITHPPHIMSRDMPTPLILSNDARSNKMINMLRETGDNNLLDCVLFDEKKTLVKLSCVKHIKRVA